MWDPIRVNGPTLKSGGGGGAAEAAGEEEPAEIEVSREGTEGTSRESCYQ